MASNGKKLYVIFLFYISTIYLSFFSPKEITPLPYPSEHK